jgi:hypothetical protein
MGCSRQPYATVTATRLPEETQHWNPVLSHQEQATIQGSLMTLAEDHSPTRVPTDAVHGVRWSDVPLAVVYACDECEMAIVRQRTTDAGYVFELKAVEGHPATFTVLRDEQSIYRSEATVGLFMDEIERAAALQKAFDRQMQSFGRKRQYRTD